MTIAETMKAVVVHGPMDYRLEQVPTPRVRAGELIMKVEACGICASDIKCWHGAGKFWGGDGMQKYVKEPMIAGHEFIGYVVDIGEGVEGFVIGDRVIAEQIVPCGKCRFCGRGQYWMCEKHDVYGFQSNVNGAFAEYMKIPVESVPYTHKVPKNLPLEKAVLIEPFACAMHTVQRADVQIGDVVVLAGAGPLGLGMVGPLAQRGAKELIVLDFKEDRLELARKFGATRTYNPKKVDVVAEVKRLTDGYGADVYIEATGAAPAVLQGLNLLRRLGRFVEMSVFGEPVTVDWSIISDNKELDVLGVHLSPYCYPIVIDGLASGRIPCDGVVTNTFALEQFEEGFRMMERGEGSIKTILIP